MVAAKEVVEMEAVAMEAATEAAARAVVAMATVVVARAGATVGVVARAGATVGESESPLAALAAVRAGEETAVEGTPAAQAAAYSSPRSQSLRRLQNVPRP